MKIQLLLIGGLLVLLCKFSFAQQNTVLGAPLQNNYRQGLYDFSDPNAVNIKVSVWGYVSRPGKYVVPEYSSVTDLLSYAGGPERDADMNDLRIYRVDKNGKEQLIKFSYNDIIWGNHLEERNRVVPALKAGDILIIPGSPKMFFKDWFNLSIQIFSVLLSIASLIIIIKRY